MTRPLTIALLITALLAPHYAQAQLVCGDREAMVLKLTTEYGEVQTGLGLSGNILLEIWASNKPPYTWTILRTYPSGVACIAATGTNWHSRTPDYTTPTEERRG